MGRFDYPAACDVFAKLASEYPRWPEVKVDLAIAMLNRRLPTDTADARHLLEETTAEHPELMRAKFCYALLLAYEGKSEPALALFREVLAQDPRDAYAAYYAGQCCLDLDRPAEAITFFETAERLDPSLRSSYYGAFQSRQRLGQTDEAKRELDIFQKLATNPQARLAEMKYSRMGPKADIRAIAVAQTDHVAASPPGPLFSNPITLDVEWPPKGLDADWAQMGQANSRVSSDQIVTTPSITVCDINQDGLLDVFVAGGLMTPQGLAQNAVLFQTGELKFRLDAEHPLSKTTHTNAALWADYDNDGLVDVYLCRRGANQLWRQETLGQWTDVTQASGTDGGEANTRDGAMFDADHDGDLDLFLVNDDAPSVLLNNNLDGTFRELGTAQGLQLRSDAALGLVVSDLDGDRDTDLVVIRREVPHEVWLNDRLWSYRAAEGFDSFCASPCTSAVAADADGDGQLELVTCGVQGLMLWKPDASGVWNARKVEPSGTAVTEGPLCVQDFNGDGQLEALVNTKSGWGVVSLSDKPCVLHEETRPVTGAPFAIAALDPSHGLAVLRLESGKAPEIWREGPGRFPFVALEFTGKNNLAEQMRSNASGIGVQAAARVGACWTTLQTFRSQSGPGQSLQPLCIGLGTEPVIDFVSILWPDGLLQTEMQLAPGLRHRIEEVQRQVSSCPVVFAWDGTCMRFVSDILGVGGIGFNLGRGQYAPPRPYEQLLLPPDALVALDGCIEISIAEPMEEACYLDSVQLVAYDIPPGWRMTFDERQATGEPACTGKPVFYQSTVGIRRCMDSNGNDVTQTLAAVDGNAVGAEQLDRRFLGRTEMTGITIELADPLEPREELTELVLVIDGWIEYPYSQTMFAAWQAGATYNPPSLEARSSDGTWHMVYDAFGYPAGMPRELSVPLDVSRLPDSITAFRLSTNMEIYWDRIILARAAECQPMRRHELPPVAAVLREIGFPKRETKAFRRPEYTYEDRVPLWDTRHQAGYYSNFGNILPLVRSTDDAVAIFGPGEEARMRFAKLNDRLDAGWTRRYVLQANGWCKDMDLYTRDGETLEPLPRRDASRDGDREDESRDSLHARFNQRFRAG